MGSLPPGEVVLLSEPVPPDEPLTLDVVAEVELEVLLVTPLSAVPDGLVALTSAMPVIEV